MARHDAMVHDASPTTLTAAVKPILAGGPIRSLYTGLRWAAVAVPAALAEDPIAESGLLRGFNDEELAAAQRAIPSRWVPRLITVTGGAYEDVNTNGERDADELATELKTHTATKAPQTPVFNMPHETSLARMLRGDLDQARRHSKGLTILQKLVVSDAKITDAGVAELQQALPNCKIEHEHHSSSIPRRVRELGRGGQS